MDPTVTIPQSLSSDPPTFLSLVQFSVVIKNTSGSPVSSTWRLNVGTAAGARFLSGSDLGVLPGLPVVTPIVPVSVPAGATIVFAVVAYVQFSRALSGPLFVFGATALQTRSQVLTQVLNGAAMASVNWPQGVAPPLPSLDPTNPNVLIPAPTPLNYAVQLLDWS